MRIIFNLNVCIDKEARSNVKSYKSNGGNERWHIFIMKYREHSVNIY